MVSSEITGAFFAITIQCIEGLADYLWTMPYLSVTWDPGWLHIVMVLLLIVPSQVWHNKQKHHVSDVPRKIYGAGVLV